MKPALMPRFGSTRTERLRLLLGIGTIVLLVGYLAIDRGWLASNRGGVNEPHEVAIPPALPSISELDAEAWRQAASDAGIQLETVEQQGPAWQLLGSTDASESLAALSRWAARRGWWAIEWEVQHDTPRSRLKIRYAAELETLDQEAAP